MTPETSKEIESCIESAYIECFKLGIGIKNYEWFDSETITWFCSNVPVSFLNGLVFGNATPEEYQREIPKLIEYFKKKKLPSMWRLSPSTKNPEALEETLQNCGATLSEMCTIVYAELTDKILVPLQDAKMTLRRVTDRKSYEQWFIPFNEAFQTDKNVSDFFFKFFENTGFGEDSKFPSYYGELNGEPIACFSICKNPGVAGGIFNIAVRDSHRGQGFGKEISLHAAKAMKEMGYRYVGQYASELGLPVYEKLGVVPLSKYPFYSVE